MFNKETRGLQKPSSRSCAKMTLYMSDAYPAAFFGLYNISETLWARSTFTSQVTVWPLLIQLIQILAKVSACICNLTQISCHLWHTKMSSAYSFIIIIILFFYTGIMLDASIWDKFYIYFVSRVVSVVFERLIATIKVNLLLFWPSAELRRCDRNQDLQIQGQYTNHYYNVERNRSKWQMVFRSKVI